MHTSVLWEEGAPWAGEERGGGGPGSATLCLNVRRYPLAILKTSDMSFLLEKCVCVWGAAKAGLQNGKIVGPKLFAPPPSRQGTTFYTHQPLFKGWKPFVTPLQYG